MQALLGYTSEARWLRYARAHLQHLFPYLPKQPGYNKRLRRLGATIGWLVGVLARDTTLWTDDVWVADSTPVECGRSRETVKRSDLAGWAEYGYCASHSRFFWGLRLHLVCTLHGLPVAFALTGAKADERETLLGLLAADPALTARPSRADPDRRQELLRPGVRGHPRRSRAGPAPPGPQGRATPGRQRSSSSRCGRSSSRSTTPSRANSTSNSTAAAPRPGYGSASCNASSP